MVLEIPFRSGAFNGLLFLVVDIFCLWAIHRGLLALQGLWICTRIRSGKPVKLKRSQIPVVSGELLMHQTTGPNVLVLVNLMYVVLAFVASLGVNGRSGTERREVMLMYVSKISADPETDYRQGIRRLRPRIFLQCKELSDENTSVNYWPGAFNTTQNAQLADVYDFRDRNNEQHHVNASTLVCQRRPMSPMLKIENCTPSSTGCSAPTDARPNILTLFGQNETKVGVHSKPWENELIGNGNKQLTLVRRTVKHAKGDDARPGDRLICIELPLVGSDNAEGDEMLNCFLLRWNESDDEARVTFGRIVIAVEKFERLDDSSVTLNLTTATGSIKWDYNLYKEKLFSEGLRQIGDESVSLTDVMDNVVSRAVVANVPTVTPRTAKGQEITIVETASWICMLIIIISAGVLGGMREIIAVASVSKGTYIQTLLGANRYDVLSSMLRDAEEGQNSLETIGKTATIAAYVTEEGTQRIGMMNANREPSRLSGRTEFRISQTHDRPSLQTNERTSLHSQDRTSFPTVEQLQFAQHQKPLYQGHDRPPSFPTTPPPMQPHQQPSFPTTPPLMQPHQQPSFPTTPPPIHAFQQFSYPSTPPPNQTHQHPAYPTPPSLNQALQQSPYASPPPTMAHQQSPYPPTPPPNQEHPQVPSTPPPTTQENTQMPSTPPPNETQKRPPGQ